jgi:hypothetical protein
MIKIQISEDQRLRANDLYNFDSLNGSITNGKSNIYGAMGEVVFSDIYADRYVRSDCFDYDFLSLDKSLSVDIKTKRTTAVPKPFWRCSISAFNINQKCDYYFFMRVSEDLQTAYVLGYLSKQEFFERAEFFKAGDPDPDKPDWKFAGDCYNVYVKELKEPSFSNKTN